MKVELEPAALKDFAAQVQWLKARTPASGRRAALAIVSTLDLLSEYPDAGREIRPGLREQHVKFGKFGFVIRYERRPDRVLVTRIFPGAQDRSGD